MTAIQPILLLAAAIAGHALITGLTVVLATRYLDGRRRSRPRAERRRPHPDTAVGHPAVPRAPEPATFTPGRVEPSPYVRWRQP